MVQYDLAGRVDTVSRGPQGSPQMTADYDYYPDGQVSRVTHGNGTAVEYEYNDANRVMRIEHLDPLGGIRAHPRVKLPRRSRQRALLYP